MQDDYSLTNTFTPPAMPFTSYGLLFTPLLYKVVVGNPVVLG